MFASLYVFLGSGLGGVARFFISRGCRILFGESFPWGTLVVNVSGSFLIGLIAVLISERYMGFAHWLHPLLVIGFLGGFTTFSSFSLDTLKLLEIGYITGFVINILCNVILCLLGAWLGLVIGRQL